MLYYRLVSNNAIVLINDIINCCSNNLSVCAVIFFIFFKVRIMIVLFVYVSISVLLLNMKPFNNLLLIVVGCMF